MYSLQGYVEGTSFPHPLLSTRDFAANVATWIESSSGRLQGKETDDGVAARP